MQPEIDKVVDELVDKVVATNLEDWINDYNNYYLEENEKGELCDGDKKKLEGIDYDKFDMMRFLLDYYFDDNSFRH